MLKWQKGMNFAAVFSAEKNKNKFQKVLTSCLNNTGKIIQAISVSLIQPFWELLKQQMHATLSHKKVILGYFHSNFSVTPNVIDDSCLSYLSWISSITSLERHFLHICVPSWSWNLSKILHIWPCILLLH